MKFDTTRKLEDKEMEMLLDEIPHFHHHDFFDDQAMHGNNVPGCHFLDDYSDGFAVVPKLGDSMETSNSDEDNFSVDGSYVLPDSLFGDTADMYLSESEFQQHFFAGFCDQDSEMTESVYCMDESTGKGHDDVIANLSSLYLDSFSSSYSANQFLVPTSQKHAKQFDGMKVRRKLKHNSGEIGVKGEKKIATSPKSQKSPVWALDYEQLMDVRGYLCFIAKDQHGCRFLQQKLEEGKHWVDLIFSGIISHVVELMVNPFGNYLMQKMLNVCSEEQTMSIILVLTEEPLVLVKISLNIHGTRAVQKLIEILRTKQEIHLVIAALQPGFLDLINDLNGNHVVQRCLQSLGVEDNKPIFDAAAIHCAEIGRQRHGCCVLQRCIAHSTGEQREKLVAAVSCNGFGLAQDCFGNYVVQYVLGLKIPSANASLAHQFEGKYINLSMQKFSSNVVERCMKVFSEADKSTMILELLAMPHFEQLLQHPYANYVIYSALQNSKGSLHAAVMKAIRPHIELLKTSPYCKRIFSRAWLKKHCK